MTLTVTPVKGNPILASWGTEIRDRTIQSFASAAERDSVWTTVPDGAFCITLDTYILWQRRSGAWQPLGAHMQAGPTTGSDTNVGGGTTATIYSWDFAGPSTGFYGVVTFTVPVAQAAGQTGAFDVNMSAVGLQITHQFPTGGTLEVVTGQIVARSTGLIQSRVSINAWGGKIVTVKAAREVTVQYLPNY